MYPPVGSNIKKTSNADEPRPMPFSTLQPSFAPAPEAFHKQNPVIMPPHKYIGINTEPGLMTLRCREVNAYKENDFLRGNGVSFNSSTVGAHPPIGNKRGGLAWDSSRYGVLGL